AAVADDGYCVHAAKIVRTLVPGRQIEQKPAAARELLRLGVIGECAHQRVQWQARPEVRRCQKHGLADRDRSGRLKRARGDLLARKVTTQNETAHAVRDSIHGCNRLAVAIPERGEKLAESRAENLDGLLSRYRAVIKKDADLTMR